MERVESSSPDAGPALGLIGEDGIRSVRDLTKEEYKEYELSKQKLLQFSYDQQLFQIVRSNQKDFETMMSRCLTDYVADPSMNWVRMDEMVKEANRLILNYLCSVRVFLDHSELKLKRRHGKTSEQVTRFKETCSKSYDGELSYRFVYQLRNYVQHCGMPVGHLSLGSKFADGVSGKIEYHLELQFDRDQLLDQYDSWGKELEDEMQKLPAMFDIKPHLATMTRCIESINSVIVSDDLPELRKNAYLVKALIDEVGRSGKGTPTILFFRKSNTGPEVRVTAEWIPVHLLADF